MAFSIHRGGQRPHEQSRATSVSHRKPPRVLYFARIAGNVGNISFSRAFLVAVEVRYIEVSPHARQLE
jgi:hypothetical protein